MTLIYRSIWQDDRPSLIDDVRVTFADWVSNRTYGQLTVVEPGKYETRTGTAGAENVITVTIEAAEAGAGLFRATYLLQTRAGVRWTTVVRSWVDDDGDGWCWVDNTVEGDDIAHLHTLEVVAPGIANKLLESAVNPRINGTAIHTQPIRFDSLDHVDELSELVTSFDRTVPIVVFAENDARFADYGGKFSYSDIVETAARKLAGIAVIAVASEEVAQEFTEVVGREYGVYNGAFRVYVRDVDPATAEAARYHRYVTADRYMRLAPTAAIQIGRIVGPQSALRRPPSSFDAAKSLLERELTGLDQFEKLYAIKSDEHETARGEVIELRRERAVLLARDDNASQLQAKLDHAMQLLVRSGLSDEFDDDGRGGFAPSLPQTPEEVVERAEKYFSDRLAIHPAALKNPQEIGGPCWSSKAWLGFRALYFYGEHLADNPQKTVEFLSWLEQFGAWCGWRRRTSRVGKQVRPRGTSKQRGTFPSTRWSTKAVKCICMRTSRWREKVVAKSRASTSSGLPKPRRFMLGFTVHTGWSQTLKVKLTDTLL